MSTRPNGAMVAVFNQTPEGRRYLLLPQRQKEFAADSTATQAMMQYTLTFTVRGEITIGHWAAG